MFLPSYINLAYAAIPVVLLVATTAIRRRYFSPISNIPGPFWASFSILWEVLEVIHGHIEETVIALHEKHGM